MLLPALGKAKSKATGIRCMNNTKQIMLACHMYLVDNNDRFPGNTHGGQAQTPIPDDPRGTWVAGWLDWGASTDNTNILYLIDRRYSKLAQYFGNSKNLFKCPADIYLSGVQRARGWTERVRSISSNIYIGDGNAESGPTDAAYVHVKKQVELINPAPAMSWMYVDEHPDSINDAGFFSPRIGAWIDLPANYHNGASGFAFVDGHSEVHKWRGSVLKIPVTITTYGGSSAPANDPDIRWIRDRTQRKVGVY